MSAHKTHHVAPYKKDVVKRFKELIKEYPIIATVNLENMPTAQLQKMRGQLRGKVVILMSKRRIMNIAIEECKELKKGVVELNKYLKGMPALIFTKENPFKLYKMLQKSKTSAPAKPGQTSPKDILIQAGPTPFAPGPVISELSMIGLKTGIEGGKVAIKEDKVVVKEGEIINDKVASMLLRLGITPMEIGLDLVAAYEDGTIFTKDVLSVDEEEYKQKIVDADSWAFNLGVEVKYPAQRILEHLISKAFNDSKALALGQKIMCSLVAEDLLSKAEREMLGLKEAANIPDATKEEKKEEVKVEEKPKEEKPVEKKEEPKPEVKEEVKEPVKEEPKKEEKTEQPVVEEKTETIEKKESIEKVEKEIKKEETTEDKISKMVEQTKKRAAGVKEPTANDLLKDVNGKEIEEQAKKADESKAVAEEIIKRIQKGEQIKKEDMPSIAELAEKRKKEKKGEKS